MEEKEKTDAVRKSLERYRRKIKKADNAQLPQLAMDLYKYMITKNSKNTNFIRDELCNTIQLSLEAIKFKDSPEMITKFKNFIEIFGSLSPNNPFLNPSECLINDISQKLNLSKTHIKKLLKLKNNVNIY